MLAKLKPHVWLLIPVLFFIAIRWILGFEGVYGQDSYEYVRYTQRLQSWLADGVLPCQYFWSVNYPLLASILTFLTPAGLACQLVSFVSFLGIVVCMQQILAHHYPHASKKSIKQFLCVGLLFSPYFFRGSLLCMSDLLAAFLLVGAWNSLLKAKQNGWHIVLSVFLLSACFTTRYASAPLIAPLLFAVILLIKKQKPPFIIIISAVVCGVIPFLPNLLLKSDAVSIYYSHQWISSWSFKNFFQFDFATHEGFSKNRIFNLMYVFGVFFHPGYLLMGAPLLYFFKHIKYHKVLWPIYLGLGLYLLFLAGIPFQNMRFLMLAFPWALVLIFELFLAAQNNLNKRLFQFALLGFLTLQTAAFTYSFGKMYRQSQQEKTMAQFFLSQPSNKTIYGYAYDVPLPYYHVKQPIKNLFITRYDAFEKGSLVLFNPSLLSTMVEGLNPMINWDKMNEDHELVSIKEFENGWQVYEIR